MRLRASQGREGIGAGTQAPGAHSLSLEDGAERSVWVISSTIRCVISNVSHFFSPSVTFRPEVAWYSSLDAKAFDNGKSERLTVFSADIIWHF